MSFDPRSRARLEALGRRLPQTLPTPQAPPPESKPTATEAGRHRLETEQNPEQLFRELMEASPDGTVPPHLLDRLRELEQRQRQSRPRGQGTLAAAAAAWTTAAQAASTPANNPANSKESGSPAPRRRLGPPGRQNPSAPRRGSTAEELELYAAFQDLLHVEQDDADPTFALPAPPRRAADDRLSPKPAARPRRLDA